MAVTIGDRGNATAMAVPSSRSGAAPAGDQQREEGVVLGLGA